MLPFASRIVLVPVYLKYLSRTDFGMLSLNSTFASALTIFMALGLDQAFVRYYFSYKQKEKVLNTYISTVFLTIMGFATVLTLSSFLYGEQLVLLLVKDKAFTFIPYGITAFLYSMLSCLNGIVLYYFRNKHQAVNYGFLAGGQFVIGTVSEFLAIVYFKCTLEQIIWVKLLTTIGYSAIFWGYLLFKTGVRYDFRFLKHSLAYSLSIVPYVFLGFIYSSYDRIVIENNFDMATLAVYSLASSIAAFVEISIVSIQNTFYPSIYGMFKEDFMAKSKAINQIFRGMGLIVMVVIAGLCFATPIAILNFIKADYSAVVYVVPFLMVSFIFRYLYVTISIPLFYFPSQTKKLPWLNVVMGGVSLALNLLLIPKIGLLGAAIANTVGRAAQVALTYYWATRASTFRFDFSNIQTMLFTLSIVLMVSAVFILNNRFGRMYDYIASSLPLVTVIFFLVHLFFVSHGEIPVSQKVRRLREII